MYFGDTEEGAYISTLCLQVILSQMAGSATVH
jgi:hypothetical protein